MVQLVSAGAMKGALCALDLSVSLLMGGCETSDETSDQRGDPKNDLGENNCFILGDLW